MPRYARNNISSKFIHLMIQGINKEYIFKDDIEIKTYLRYLRQKIKDTNVKIISYCMMNNHAHILIYYKDIDEVSKLMSKVNTKYAIFYNNKNNRCGVVFRNRYNSQEILTYSHLITCIKYIHNNPIKAGICEKASDYKYSSYNEYKQSKGILLDWNFIEKKFDEFNIKIENILNGYEDNDTYRFIENDDFDEKEFFKEIILKNYMHDNNIDNIDDIKESKRHLKNIVSMMYFKYNLKKQEISEILNVNRLKIYRIINEIEGVSQNVQK